MGLMTEGTPLTWEETKNVAEHIKQQGIRQFINLYHRLKDRKNDQLKWGDEIEYILVHFDDEKKRAQLALRAPQILPLLQRKELKAKENPNKVASRALRSLWKPEYANFMVEGTPGVPYGSYLSCFNDVENNMRLRRNEVQKLLQHNERVLTFTSFPRMGCPEFTFPPIAPTPGKGMTQSLFFPDGAVYQEHPRFGCFTVNTRVRRGMKPDINIPVFKDINTRRPFIEDFVALGDADDAKKYSKPDHIYLDAMGFGNGCCCLQVTFQACNIVEARHLYDQLATLCPFMLALSAGTPILRGYLSDVDVRWQVLVETSDDRTDEERGLLPLKNDKYRIAQSRYECVDCYISPLGETYNDVKLNFDERFVKQMMDTGIDRLLAEHVAHLFIRDPLVMMSEKVNQDDNDTDHFEPPLPESGIGWRVEFRPMEIQMTDFENAAFVTFIVLMTRLILSFNLSFLVPISKVGANMKEAQKRNAAREGLFYFPENVLPASGGLAEQSFFNRFWKKRFIATNKDEYPKLSINEIFNGKTDQFPGLIALVEEYLKDMDLDIDTSTTLQTYLCFIRKRASGELLTTASWIRKFVANHSAYKHDSVVSEEINYDLMKACDAIARGALQDPELLIKHICVPGRELEPDSPTNSTDEAKQLLPNG